MSEVNDPIIQLIEEYLSGEMEDVRREELTAWLDKKEEKLLEERKPSLIAQKAGELTAPVREKLREKVPEEL